MSDFERSLDASDLKFLFGHVATAMTDGDRRSLSGLQRAGREAKRPEGYVYLEIGSHLGGSLQSFVPDPLCRKIYSIDTRPKTVADVRGGEWGYGGNTTENMLKHLSRVPGADLNKVVTLEEGTDRLDPAAIDQQPDLCFIDAEHTDKAVLRDSTFCRTVLRDNGWIAFHDANIIYEGLSAFLGQLQKEGVGFSAHILEDAVFLIALGERPWMRSASLAELSRSSAKGFLYGMHENDRYRSFYYRPVFQMVRSAKWRLKKRFATGAGHQSDESYHGSP